MPEAQAPTPPPDPYPALARALINLRGDSLASITQATGIRAANLSVWLRGKEQVISARRVARLLHYLGWEEGRLRPGILHKWEDAGELEDLRLVGNLAFKNGEAVVLQDRSREFERTFFLVAPGVLVRVRLQKGAATARQIQEVLAVKAVGMLDIPFGAVPDKWDFTEFVRFLEALCWEHAKGEEGRHPDDQQAFLVAQTYIQAMGAGDDDVPYQEWAELEAAIRRALSAKMGPGAIAQAILRNLGANQ